MRKAKKAPKSGKMAGKADASANGIDIKPSKTAYEINVDGQKYKITSW